MSRLHDPVRLEAALRRLVGLPLTAAHRAADMQTFSFGADRTTVFRSGPRKGQPRIVGEWALHVSCAWRIRGPIGIVVASRDRYYRAGSDPDADGDWDWDVVGANRCDERIHAWQASRSYDVLRVSADTVGGFAITLADEFVLEAFPDDSLDGEHWRLFVPGDDAPHFVVTGAGIED